jgi:starvation-inducible DNA-binding protein
MTTAEAKLRRAAPLKTPSDLGAEATKDLSGALNILLADLFALYLKTKNFHWHISGPHFRDYHLMLDEQADQIFAMTDTVAERVRKVGGGTLRSIGQVAKLQRVLDNDADYVSPLDMLAELREDNMRLAAHMRETHSLCDERGDVATASLLEVWIDETEKRVWYLFEASRRGDAPGAEPLGARRGLDHENRAYRAEQGERTNRLPLSRPRPSPRHGTGGARRRGAISRPHRR